MDLKQMIAEYIFNDEMKEKSNLEREHLQILVSGRLKLENWNTSSDKVDFFFMKEKVEHILSRLGINNFVSSEGKGWECYIH